MIDLECVMQHISGYKYPEIIKVRCKEADFIDDLIDVGNQVNKVLLIISHLVIEKPKDETEKAILMGHMTYLYKLYDSFLYLLIDNKTEIAMIILRTLAEISIRLRYLANNINSSICEKFIKSSLAYAKKQYDEINHKIKGKTPTPIEERMQSSIRNRFIKAGYQFEDINFQKDQRWCKDSSQLAKDLGMDTEYEFAFRTGSVAVHAGWDFLELYNLNEENGKYSPNRIYAGVKPQIIEGGSYLVTSSRP